MTLRTFGLSSLTLTATLTTGCGDPCLDDGLGKPGTVCNAQDGADEIGTETGLETSDTNEAEGESADAAGEETFCTDADMDGFGDPDDCEMVPAGEDPPPGTVPEGQATDCNDGDPNTFPGAAENDDPNACMTDADDDGWGDAMPTAPGAVPGTDCDDDDELVFACELWCEDMDLDGYGNPLVCVTLQPGEDPPPGYVQDGTDCLDTDPNAFPGAAELDDPNACMLDADEDGWGDDEPPEGVAQGRDCDDADMAAVVCADAVPACVDTTQGIGAQLMASASGGDGNYSFAWTPVDTLSDPNIADPIATPVDITTYTVTATDGLGNMGSDDITVHLTDKPWVLGGPNAECEAVGFLGDPAEHSFSPDGTQTCTTSNSDPTAFVCPIVHEQARITGTMVVNTTDDDDIIGFVWGWQSMDQFYLLSWKQSYQNWFGCNGNPGITVKLVDRTQPYVAEDFACDVDTSNVAVLMTPAETTTQGWIDNREYGVEILYDQTQTEITITDLSNNMEVVNFVVMDGTYPSGQFGTYDFSQVQACNGPWQSSCL